MLTLCGQTFEPVWTDFGARTTWTAEWRERVNAMGEIPVLEENGRALTQTGPILLHLSRRFGRFAGASEAEAFEVMRWLFWDNQKLSGHMATYRFLRTFSPNPDPAVLKWLKARVDDFLGVLDTRLTGRDFVASKNLSVADLSLCAYLSFPIAETGYDFSESHPHVMAWLLRLAATPGWAPPYDLLPGRRLPTFLSSEAPDSRRA